MPRTPSDPPTWHDPPGHDSITLKLKLITPMFGGGYEPREVDEVLPIRPAAIRGHLRFWWRATAGAQYASAANLFNAEKVLWGSMDEPGKVRIQVREWTTPQIDATDPRMGQPDAYALWPARATPGNPPLATAQRAKAGMSFTLILSYPASIADAVSGAVNAWLCLGGLGARTRRGCGSLSTDGAPPPDIGRLNCSHGRSDCVTVLSGARYVLGPTVQDPVAAWQQSVRVYAAFRQMRYPGHPPMPGRSKWPEPDSIRRIERRSHYAHQPRHPVQRGFPRAELGLPIVFHFRDRDDPEERTLQAKGDGATRFASPVITKALALPEGGYKPLIAVLQAPHAWALGDLDLNGTSVPRAWIELTLEERKKVEPLAGRDPRSAVLEFARAKWNSQVKVLP